MIYVHIPFCRSFCTYCDFYSEIASDEDFERYADAVCREIAGRKEEITDEVNTLYIGGGTPSVPPLSVLKKIVSSISKGPYQEFTIEVNPEDIIEKGPGYVEGLRDLGANRISMGVQSFDDRILRWMNRRHNAERAEEAFHMLREGGFDNISIDLIFGFSMLTEKLWEDTIEKALGLAPEHISCYQLSIEEGSHLASLFSKGLFKEASQEYCSFQYNLLCKRLREAGYHHYEISNFSLPGKEALHNSAYWRRVPYVGFGPGAHSFDGRVRRWNSESIFGYTFEEEVLSAEDIRVEKLMLGLRTDRGLTEDFLHENCSPESLDNLVSGGMLVSCGEGRLRIGEDYFFVADNVIRELI